MVETTVTGHAAPPTSAPQTKTDDTRHRLGQWPRQEYADDRLVSVADVARQLGVCTRTIHRLVAAGELQPPVKVGRAARWFGADIAGYLARLRQNRHQQYAAQVTELAAEQVSERGVPQ